MPKSLLTFLSVIVHLAILRLIIHLSLTEYFDRNSSTHIVVFFAVLISMFFSGEYGLSLRVFLDNRKRRKDARYAELLREPEQRAVVEQNARESKPQEQPEALEPEPEPPPEPIDGVLIGTDIETNQPLHILTPLRGRHLYLIGKTRTGKTTLIKNLIIQDMEAGHGLCMIDPHGDCAEELIGSVPPERLKDVIYFDPTSEYCPAFNFLALPYPAFKLTEDIIAVFKMFFGDSWGQRMEHLLRYSLLTLLMNKNTYTLNDLKQLITNENARADILNGVTDDGVLAFWNEEFPRMAKGAPDPIVNKLSAFLAPSSPMYRVFSNSRNDLNFTEILDGKILIVNLAKGKVGDEPSKILGGMIASGIQQASLARADTPMEQRHPFYFYVDEFQNYVTPAFETILSESAKYNLFLTLAHQTLHGQIPASMESAIFGNIATLISFQVSADDANRLKREMHRTRFEVRAKESPAFMSVDGFLEKERGRLAKRQQDIEHEKKIIEQQVLMDMESWRGQEKPPEAKAWRRETNKEYEKLVYEEFEINRKLEALNDSNKNLHSLRDIFSDYQFKETDFPDTQDFINIPPRTAFCRMERAENLHVFRTIKSPDPVAGIRGQVLHAMREQYGIKAKPAEPARPIAIQPVEQPATDTETVEDLKRILEEAVTGGRIDGTPPNDPPKKPTHTEPTSPYVNLESEPPSARTRPQASEPPAPDPFGQKEPPTRRQRRRQKQKSKKDQLSF